MNIKTSLRPLNMSPPMSSPTSPVMSLAIFPTKERSFNRIEIFEKTVKKTIFDLHKGSQELFFYKKLSPLQKKYFPKIIDYAKNPQSISYEMERIPSFDLSVFYLNGQLKLTQLQTLFGRLDRYWEQIPKIKCSPQKWQHMAFRIVIDKMNTRWDQYKTTEVYKKVSKQFWRDDKIDLVNFKNNLEQKLITHLREQKENLLYATHGDLCFSNIFLMSSKKIKFVDPRGGYKTKDCFIPLIYDLAKLSQCINGNYDGILANKEIEFNKQRQLFKRWIISKKINFTLVRLVESSLLLSLLPLHLDRPESHKKMIQASMTALRSCP